MKRHAPLAVLCLAACATPALAVDTWEPYPVGPSVLEVYVTRYGWNADADADKGYRATFGPAWGLWDGVHAYSFLSLASDDASRGGLDFLSLGAFAGLLDRRALDVDVYAELGAVGPGLEAAYRLVGLEANLDFDGWGAFGRAALQWEDGTEDGGDAVVARRKRYTEGVYLQPSQTVQIFLELTQDDTRDVPGLPDGRRRTSLALGYNRVLTQQVEMLVEARRRELPPGVTGDRPWDYTVGFVTVW